MKLRDITNKQIILSGKESYNPTIYPQFEAQINGEYCKIKAVYHEGGPIEDIDITPLNDFMSDNIYNTLNFKEAQLIQDILWDILRHCKTIN